MVATSDSKGITWCRNGIASKLDVSVTTQKTYDRKVGLRIRRNYELFLGEINQAEETSSTRYPTGKILGLGRARQYRRESRLLGKHPLSSDTLIRRYFESEKSLVRFLRKMAELREPLRLMPLIRSPLLKKHIIVVMGKEPKTIPMDERMGILREADVPKLCKKYEIDYAAISP